MPMLSKATPLSKVPQEMVWRYHTHDLNPVQCSSINAHEIAAPLSTVWSLVRRFDEPQCYKGFIRDCSMRAGDGGVGSVREVQFVSGFPATSSTERLDELDEGCHLISFSTIAGDLRLDNYRSTTTLHENDGGRGTVVVESYVVDVPSGNTPEETRIFADTIVRCNLRSLARITERIALA